MIDLPAILRAWLVAQPAIITTYGQRVYVGLDLPSSYRPNDGPALILTVRPGRTNSTGVLWTPAVWTRAYALTEEVAETADRQLSDVLDGRAFGPVKQIYQEQTGQLARDPKLTWPFVLSIYRVSATRE